MRVMCASREPRYKQHPCSIFVRDSTYMVEPGSDTHCKQQKYSYNYPYILNPLSPNVADLTLNYFVASLFAMFFAQVPTLLQLVY